MTLIAKVNEAREKNDWGLLVQNIPYAHFLGLRLDVKGDELTCVMPFKDALVGNPVLPALHGGSVGGFMECAAIFHLLWQRETVSVPKTIDFSIDYLRSPRAVETYARAIMVKMGSRIANLRVEAWQTDRYKPVATAHGNFLLQTG